MVSISNCHGQFSNINKQMHITHIHIVFTVDYHLIVAIIHSQKLELFPQNNCRGFISPVGYFNFNDLHLQIIESISPKTSREFISPFWLFLLKIRIKPVSSTNIMEIMLLQKYKRNNQSQELLMFLLCHCSTPRRRRWEKAMHLNCCSYSLVCSC